MKLGFMYFLILCIHSAIHFLMYTNRSSGTKTGEIVNDFGYYFIWIYNECDEATTLCDILLVIYTSICETCNRIQLLNHIFSLYISLVFGSVIVSFLSIELWDLINVLTNGKDSELNMSYSEI